jgi:hypothetical protein
MLDGHFDRSKALSPPVLDFDPGRSENYIRAFVFSFWFGLDRGKRVGRAAAIAAVVAGRFHEFATQIMDLTSGLRGDVVPASGTLSRLLAPFQNNPIIARPAWDLIEAVVRRFGSTNFDHIGTERDFWRLCRRDDVGNFIYTVDYCCFERGQLLRDLAGTTDDDSELLHLASALPCQDLMSEAMSLMLGDPMLAGLSLVVFETIGKHHKPNFAEVLGDPKFAPSLGLARDIIAASVKIDHKRIGKDRQNKAWRGFKEMSTLWAGILAEAQPWHPVTLVDEYSLQNSILRVLSNDVRRLRAFQFAQWFSLRATTNAHQRSDRAHLIAPSEIVQLRYVKDDEPQLPPLPIQVLRKALALRARRKM